MVSLESRAQMPAWKGEVDEAEQEGIAGGQRLGAEGDRRRERRRHWPQGPPLPHGLRRERPLQSRLQRRGKDHPVRQRHPGHRPAGGPVLPGRRRRSAGDAARNPQDRRDLMTTAPGVFAGGDVAFGPRILVEAVANGHRAARSIHVYLSGKTKKTVRSRFRIMPNWSMPRGFLTTPRQKMPVLAANRRIGIAEVELGFDEEQGRAEGLALPQLPGQHDLRRIEVHSLRRLRGRMPGELSAPGRPRPGKRGRAIRRADSEIAMVCLRSNLKLARPARLSRTKRSAFVAVSAPTAVQPVPSPWSLWNSRSGKSLSRRARA